MKRLLLLTTLFIALFSTSYAQVDGPAVPLGNKKSTIRVMGALDVDSLLNIPRRSGLNGLSFTPYPGSVIFNTDDLNVYIYDGSDWVPIGNNKVDSLSSSNDSLFFWVKGNAYNFYNAQFSLSGGDTMVFQTVVDSTGQPGQRILWSANNKIRSNQYLLFDSANHKLVINNKNVSVGGPNTKLFVGGNVEFTGQVKNSYAPNNVVSDTTNYKPIAVDASGNYRMLDRWPGSGGTTPTLQQVLTAGSALTTSNTIDVGVSLLKIGKNATTSYTSFGNEAINVFSQIDEGGGNITDNLFQVSGVSGIRITSSGDFVNRGYIIVKNGITLQSSSPFGGDAYIKMLSDSIVILPYNGIFRIRGLNQGAGTKSLRLNPSTGDITYDDIPTLTESDPTVSNTIKNIPVSADVSTNKYLNWNGSTYTRKQVDYSELTGSAPIPTLSQVLTSGNSSTSQLQTGAHTWNNNVSNTVYGSLSTVNLGGGTYSGLINLYYSTNFVQIRPTSLTGSYTALLPDKTGTQTIAMVSDIPSTSGFMTNPMINPYDLIIGGTGGTPTRFGIGSNGQVLGIVSGTLSWITGTPWNGLHANTVSNVSGGGPFAMGTQSFQNFTGTTIATWTLPDRATNAARSIWVKNAGTATLTIQRAGTDQIWTNSAINSITLNPGESISFTSIGGYWNTHFDGNVNLSTSTKTSITGILKGNGASLSAAVAGTDYVAPNTAIAGATKTKITYDSKGLVTAGADATTSDIAEGTNQYFTTARVLSTALTGYAVGTNTALATTDNILAAFGKLQAQLNNKQASGSYLTSETDPVVKAVNGLVKSNGATISSAIAGTDYVVPTSFVDSETPSGLVNGSNTSFTLSNTPISGSVKLFKNGVRLRAGAGNDYTISGSTITMLTAPQTGDILVADYRK